MIIFLDGLFLMVTKQFKTSFFNPTISRPSSDDEKINRLYQADPIYFIEELDTLLGFQSFNHYQAFTQQYYTLIDNIDLWCKEMGIQKTRYTEPTPGDGKRAETLFGLFSRKLFSLNKFRQDLFFSEGKKALESIWVSLQDERIPLDHKKNTLLNLQRFLTVCADGVFTNILSSERLLREYTGISSLMDNIKFKLIEDYTIKYVRANHKGSRPGDEIHFVNAYRNHVAVQYGIPLIKDQFIPSSVPDEKKEHFASKLSHHLQPRLVRELVLSHIEEEYKILYNKIEHATKAMPLNLDERLFDKLSELLSDKSLLKDATRSSYRNVLFTQEEIKRIQADLSSKENDSNQYDVGAIMVCNALKQQPKVVQDINSCLEWLEAFKEKYTNFFEYKCDEIFCWNNNTNESELLDYSLCATTLRSKIAHGFRNHFLSEDAQPACKLEGEDGFSLLYDDGIYWIEIKKEDKKIDITAYDATAFSHIWPPGTLNQGKFNTYCSLLNVYCAEFFLGIPPAAREKMLDKVIVLSSIENGIWHIVNNNHMAIFETMIDRGLVSSEQLLSEPVQGENIVELLDSKGKKELLRKLVDAGPLTSEDISRKRKRSQVFFESSEYNQVNSKGVYQARRPSI